MPNPTKKLTVPKDSVVGGAIETSAFKQSLVDTLQESNTARTEMKTILHEILRQPDTIQEIKDIINKADRDSVKAFWSKFGFTVWSVIVFILGVAVNAIMQKFIGK